MRSPEEARIKKLEERNEDYRTAIEEAIERLEDAHNPNGFYDDKDVDATLAMLRQVALSNVSNGGDS